MDLEIKKFSQINLADPFFDSLKDSYEGFDNWFAKKAREEDTAYVFYGEDGLISDFLYLKIETETVNDVEPILPAKKRLKVGTFKLKSRGTRRGERFMKKIMDRAVADDVDEIYVTIFPKPELQNLINSFQKFGFEHVANKPHGERGSELVLLKNMRSWKGDVEKDYPFVKVGKTDKYLLSIRPDYHTKLFPDSILNNESYDLVQDITPTNSIYKIYICWMKDAAMLKCGDNVVIYRTSDGQGSAYYRSVATSICTVMEVKRYIHFKDLSDFLYYTQYSVFSEIDRKKWYQYNSNFIVIKMLYNVAFTKRVIRKELLETAGMNGDSYWGIYKLSDGEYQKIIKLGKTDERYFID